MNQLKKYPIYSKFLKLGSKYCIDIDNTYELDLLGLKCWPNYDLKMFEKLRKGNHLQGSTSNGKVFYDCQSKYNTSFFQSINFSVLLSPKRFKNYPHLLKLTKSWFKILYWCLQYLWFWPPSQELNRWPNHGKKL